MTLDQLQDLLDTDPRMTLGDLAQAQADEPEIGA